MFPAFLRLIECLLSYNIVDTKKSLLLGVYYIAFRYLIDYSVSKSN